MNLVKKITVPTVYGKIKGFALNEAGDGYKKGQSAVHLMRVVGNVTGTKSGQTQLGGFTKLLGSFEATNVETGEVFSSAQCILPSIVNDQIVAKVAAAGDSPAVLFAVDLYATVPTKVNAYGYEYSAKPIGDVKAADPLAELRAGLPALPAPKAPPAAGDGKK